MPLQEEVSDRQRLQADELYLEIGNGIAIDVAGNDGLVAGCARKV